MELLTDIVLEIASYLPLHKQLVFGQLNKYYNRWCKQHKHLSILRYNVHQKLEYNVKDDSYYNIRDNKLFIVHGNTSAPIQLPINIIPISVTSTTNRIVILTDNNELYGQGSNDSGQLGCNKKDTYYHDFKKIISPPGKIIQVCCTHYTYVLTTEGLYLLCREYIKIADINIYLFHHSGDCYKYATPNGLHIVYKNLEYDINYIGTVLAIYKHHVITTSGLYEIITSGGVGAQKVNENDVKKIAYLDNNKLLILTNKNHVKHKLFYDNVTDISVHLIQINSKYIHLA